ncbi:MULTISPECIES: SIR2 family NAD-dependent protein deacylase [Flavobacterium]|uniref:SIR2 family protein n=1 Tax=Flavobacterium jumunjinense TaxID=998845 RepID=A0ABV5GQI7_9FLAO|nr:MULTISPECIES: SIR2 family protein [Flavobacterium]
MSLLPQEKLTDLLKQKKVIPFIGAGFSSATANVPGWLGLIKNGLEYARVRNIDTRNLIEQSENELSKNNLLEAANFLKEVLNAPSFPFSNWIKEEFENLKIVSSDLINSVLDLNQDIIFTTNYDTLLTSYNNIENKQLFIHNEYDQALNSLKLNNEIVMHLHGIFSKPDSLILSKNDYDLLNKNLGYKSFMQKMLSDYHFLFIGCSKDGVMDDDFLIVFNFIKDWFSISSNQHFILLHEKEVTNKNHIKLLTECNIESIVYGNDYNLLSPFINSINPNYVERQEKISKYQDKLDSEFKRIATKTKNFTTETNSLDSFLSSNLNSKYDWVDSEKMKAFENILSDYNNSIKNKKEKLKFTQTIILSIFNISELKEKVELWSKYSESPKNLDPLNFITTALIAYDCLLKIPKEIVSDIKHSNHYNVLHYGFYNDNLGKFINEIKLYKKLNLNLEEKCSDDRYLFENLKRIIQSLKSFLELDSETFYKEIENATINKNIPKSFIVIVTDKSITLRNENDQSIIYAELPLNENFRVSKIEIVSVENKILIFGFNSNTCFYWNPKEDIFMNTFYFSEKYQINDFIIDKEDNEIVVYLKVNGQIIVLKKFIEENKIDILENFTSSIKYSNGFLSLKRMDSSYKGDVFYKTDFSGKTNTLFTVNSLVDELKCNKILNELITDFVKDDPFGNWLSIIDVKQLYRIEKEGKEIIILRSSFLTQQDSSVLFIFEIIQEELILKELIHLKYSVCFCLDYFITEQNNLKLVCGYLNMNGNKVLCEVIELDENYKIIFNKIFNNATISEDFNTTDTLECFFTNENTIILKIEREKILTFSLVDESKNKIQILENINTVKFYNSIK